MGVKGWVPWPGVVTLLQNEWLTFPWCQHFSEAGEGQAHSCVTPHRPGTGMGPG